MPSSWAGKLLKRQTKKTAKGAVKAVKRSRKTVGKKRGAKAKSKPAWEKEYKKRREMYFKSRKR